LRNTWVAYLKDESIISPERDYLLTIHPTPAEYSTFYLFVQAHPNPIDAIDATELGTDELIALISTHTGPNAVHVTTEQAQEVYKILHVPEEI
tara:strand:- start:8737 stop:9015 length:279 start_codon:yes stop_codon:yes gene_type:complete